MLQGLPSCGENLYAARSLAAAELQGFARTWQTHAVLFYASVTVHGVCCMKSSGFYDLLWRVE
jgi:hypothetical protein